MFDLTLNPAQQQLRTDAAAFAQEHLKPATSLYAHLPTQRARFEALRPIYAVAVKAGLIKGQIPTALGGSAESMVDAAIVVEEFFAVDPSAALTILGTGLGLTPLLLAGGEELRSRVLARFLVVEDEGDKETRVPIASFVHSEPGGTANWLEKGGAGLGTTARREGDEWVINGEKMWATNCAGWDGRGADLQCIVCRLSETGGPPSPDENPAAQILILAVTAETIAANPPEAYAVLSEPELAGFPCTSGPHVRLTNLRVPHADLLCPPGQGAQVVEQTFGSSAALVGAMGVGIMRAAFEAALGFARRETRRGVVPVLERQSVADLLIDVKMRIEAARLLAWKALHGIEKGPGAWETRLEIALEAKIFSSEAAVRSVVDCMKAVGVASYSKDQPFSKLLAEATILPLFDGGNVGVRRRQLERIFQDPGYQPWAATYE
ncbi:hypothetical protein M406DRAFT_37062 [Cryphonectria parasitica EP155]|uniref:Acyl-CoA dehydrogenase n=1 Tax=Cryphonectria parasitica (strain ATCC 38755 / EP155) TaxID=660469 RepID=A0A9P4Y1R5_CRYP1|nr:uncharacterized protein M406DRAFT_37062 [Cryphonectria parasitica EP155]KAF3765399.1 hypothetical protein M406DRAFT_37062 [Cryphonectria parasitica EP155]